MTISVLFSAMLGSAAAHADDWRTAAADAERIAKLIELVPNTAVWMQQMGHRYGDLYFAAKRGHWEFAAYQAEEMEKLIGYVELASPKRAESAQAFRAAVFPQLHEVLGQRDWQAFEPAFERLSGECMKCHVSNDHAFVVLPLPPRRHHSPVLDE